KNEYWNKGDGTLNIQKYCIMNKFKKCKFESNKALYYIIRNMAFGLSAGERDKIEFIFKKKFLSKIDVDLIIWSRIFVISKKIFLSIWSLFPALTPFARQWHKLTAFHIKQWLYDF